MFKNILRLLSVDFMFRSYDPTPLYSKSPNLQQKLYVFQRLYWGKWSLLISFITSVYVAVTYSLEPGFFSASDKFVGGKKSGDARNIRKCIKYSKRGARRKFSIVASETNYHATSISSVLFAKIARRSPRSTYRLSTQSGQALITKKKKEKERKTSTVLDDTRNWQRPKIVSINCVSISFHFGI